MLQNGKKNIIIESGMNIKIWSSNWPFLFCYKFNNLFDYISNNSSVKILKTFWNSLMHKASMNDLGQLLLLLRYTNAYVEFTIKTPQKLRRLFSRQFQTNIALTSIVFSKRQLTSTRSHLSLSPVLTSQTWLRSLL